ncbi:Ankrd17, partial [Symbiodinium necroappetens]
IAKCAAARGAWFGAREEWKWRQLAALLPERFQVSDEFRSHLEAPSESRDFARALVEWALSVQAARKGLESGAGGLELRYEDLIRTPEQVLEQIEALLSLPPSPEPRRFAAETLRPGPGAAASAAEAEVLKLVAGSGIDVLLGE